MAAAAFRHYRVSRLTGHYSPDRGAGGESLFEKRDAHEIGGSSLETFGAEFRVAGQSEVFRVFITGDEFGLS